MRYLAIDFETNGLPNEGWLQPRPAFPTQVSVDAFDPATGEVTHLYDSFVRGSMDLSKWVQQHTPVTLELLDAAPHPSHVASSLAELWCEGDVIVAHNAQFDLGRVLPMIADPWHPFLTSPRICTKSERWVRLAVGKTPSMADLCKHLKVAYNPEEAHDATYDTHVLAHCLKAAHEDRYSWSMTVPVVQEDKRVDVPLEPRKDLGDTKLNFGKYRGRTYRDVLYDHDYCRYWLEQASTLGAAQRLVAWLKTQTRLCRGCGSPKDPDGGSYPPWCNCRREW